MTPPGPPASPAFDRSRALLEGPIVPSLLKLAVPIVLATILQSAYQLTDAWWVGRLGGAAVAAVSVSFPVIFLIISIGAGLGIAGSTLVAQYVGARNEKMVNHVAAQTLLMVAVTSMLLGAIGYAIAPGLLRLMGVASDVFPGARQFMRVSFVGLVFTFGFAMFQAVMRGVGQVTLPLYIVFGTVLLNFALDPLFIFGWGPVPRAGVAGAAAATFGTQSLAAAIGFIVLLNGGYGIHLHLRDFVPDWAFVKRAFSLGLPASIEQSARGLGMTIMTFLIASFGTVPTAAYGVGFNVLSFVIIPAIGLSLATATLVGQNIGARQIARAERIARLGAAVSFTSLTVAGVVVFVCARPMAAFFVPHDPLVIAETVRFLHIVALSFGLIGLQFALQGVFRAAGQMVVTMVLVLLSAFVIQFPLAFVLSKHTRLGVDGLWWSFPLTSITMTAVTLAWFARGDWKGPALTGERAQAEHVTEEILIDEGVRQ